MPVDLEIGFALEALEDGSPEERAAFGLFKVQTRHGSLTEGWDHFLNGSRSGPMVSAYFIAEWFAWNWWRLRWEPRRSSLDWDPAHRMNTIGEGYVWPNITIFSDGERTALLSAPSVNPDAKPFRFFGSTPIVVPSRTFESSVDEFVGQVLGRLQTQHVDRSNLNRLWADILAERVDPEIARRRRIEAMLGRDPDSIDDEQVEQLIADARQLGEEAVQEIAADQGQSGNVNGQAMTANQFAALAEVRGFDAAPRDAVRLGELALPRRTDVPAWKLGAMAAQSLREKERLGSGKIQNNRLAAMAGTERGIVAGDRTAGDGISFTLTGNPNRSKIVLSSKREAGRRFALARLIGDHLLSHEGSLHPATRSHTYRQMAQRSFAAELLSPFSAIEDMMAGDYSPEMQEDVAHYFSVSEWTIRTLLLNHGRIDRDDLEENVEALVA